MGELAHEPSIGLELRVGIAVESSSYRFVLWACKQHKWTIEERKETAHLVFQLVFVVVVCLFCFPQNVAPAHRSVEPCAIAVASDSLTMEMGDKSCATGVCFFN